MPARRNSNHERRIVMMNDIGHDGVFATAFSGSADDVRLQHFDAFGDEDKWFQITFALTVKKSNERGEGQYKLDYDTADSWLDSTRLKDALTIIAAMVPHDAMSEASRQVALATLTLLTAGELEPYVTAGDDAAEFPGS